MRATYQNIADQESSNSVSPGTLAGLTWEYKKIRAPHAKEKQQIRERAGTRIALTCKFGQPGEVGVRIFYDKFVDE
jgi:hypothetical protein